MTLEERFASLTVRGVEAFKADQAQETLHLDFKTLAGTARLDAAPDKENLAKAISGFANSEGGLIVWGVDARKNDEGIDCVVGLKPIENIPLLVSRLNELTNDAASPAVAGVQHRPIARRGEKRGFAATLVPASDAGPHMAKLAGLNRYYRRNGTSFLAMEHFELADMFGRRARPKLKITTHIKGIGLGAEIVICLKNEGRGSARAPYLALNIRRGPFKLAAHGLSGGGYDGMTRKKAPTRGYSVAFAEGSDFVIHPGVELDVTLYHTGIVKMGVSLDRDVEIDYALCAESCPLEEGTIVIPLAALSP